MPDSHQLSFAEGAVVRDSIVDNLLLSLDQFSTGQMLGSSASAYANYPEGSSFPRDSSYRPPSRRHHGHGYSSSRSSDPQQPLQDLSRSRKGSIRDLCMGWQHNSSYESSSPPQHSRERGRNSSKGSMDFGRMGMFGTQRSGFAKRSASLDYINTDNGSGMLPPTMESILGRGRMAYQNYPDDQNAAPQPAGPAGLAGSYRVQDLPSSLTAPLSQSPYALPQSSRPRGGSLCSNTSYKTLRKNRTLPESNMRAQAQDFINANALRDLSEGRLMHEPSAPSPMAGARQPEMLPFGPAPPTKEKAGFFRRVFGGGSSKTRTQSTTPQPESHSASISHRSLEDEIRPHTTPNNASHSSNTAKFASKTPQSASGHQKEHQSSASTVVTKKTSFFRRRKKSVSENTRPIMAVDFTPPQRPLLPAQFGLGASPFHQAMDAYLSDASHPTERFYEAQERQANQGDADADLIRTLSRGYSSRKDPAIRAAEPNLRRDEKTPITRDGQGETPRLSSLENPSLKLRVNHGKSLPPTRKAGVLAAEGTSFDDHKSASLSFTASSSGVNEAWKHTKDSTLPPVSHLNLKGRSDSRANRDEQVQRPLDHLSFSQSVFASQAASEAVDGLLPERLRATMQFAEILSPSTPVATTPASPNDVFHSATSLPIVQIDIRESDTAPVCADNRPQHKELEDAALERALQMFHGDDSSISKSQAATVLGDVSVSATHTRTAFMNLFDWTGFHILAAMRDMCSRLVLKAETQQVDRILMSLSQRWCECNPSHGFRAVDVVHTICYSILLLNTDLHLADIESRMTRTQFVRNTLPTVVRVCQDALRTESETLRPQSTHFRRGSIPWNNRSESDVPTSASFFAPADASEESSQDTRTRSRLSIRPPRSSSDGPLLVDSALSESNLLVNNSYHGPMRGWEIQVEVVLKEFYDSIRKQRLPLHGVPDHVVQPQPSSNNLSINNVLRRTPSVLSKAPSDSISYRGRLQPDSRSVGPRWANKNRSKQRLYPSSTVASSRTSLDDGSVWSPTRSSFWSRHSLGKTGTSMSMDSFGSHFANGDYQQAIGFANALSQAIIREEGTALVNEEEFARAAPLLEDETLELAGAPWAKEGILKHKHHLESMDKKAKDRAWSERFAVVEKGCMRLFSFTMSSKSTRNKSKSRPSTSSVVGGGNWMDNAEALGNFPLRQTIASALPPPGYSKLRSHVFALSLPTGAVHLFQVGTPDIVREFVCTINYWSARLSKEPLTGGVSSMEYGWSENVINTALIRRGSTPSVRGHVPRLSMASSLGSSIDHSNGAPKAKLPGDRANLFDWTPPTASMMASNLMEVDQLRALVNYVKTVEGELGHHNDLRAPLLITFSPRHPNAAKAMANWERKSQYLLREIVKFRTYIDTLTAAQMQKEKIYAERAAYAKKDLEAGGAGNHTAQAAEDDGAKADLNRPEPTAHLPLIRASSPLV